MISYPSRWNDGEAPSPSEALFNVTLTRVR